MGMVELSGQAAGPYTVIAPITERSCYYFRTIVWEWKRQGRNNAWVKVASECTHVPFFLDDNTGKVMVDPRGAELDLHRDFQQEFCDALFTIKEEAPPNVHALLSRHGISTTNKIKVEEFCIKPKNALFVLGTLGDNPGLELAPKPILDDEAQHSDLSGCAVVQPTAIADRTKNSVVRQRRRWRLVVVIRPPVCQRTHDRRRFPFGIRIREDALGQIDFEEESRHASSAKVIQLSPHSDSPGTADMTQQQKIAAALRKAGVSNPAAWSAAGITPSRSYRQYELVKRKRCFDQRLRTTPRSRPHEGRK